MKKKGVLLLFLIFIVFKGYSQTMQCALVQTDSVYPLPDSSGHYNPGEVVTFCYSLQGYYQWGSNWVCGFVLKFGAGWDTTSLIPISSPGSCDGTGVWGFYDSCISTGTHMKFGQGFYYVKAPAYTPGNNLGDYTVTGSCVWNLCFSIKVKDTSNSKDLSAFVTAVGDGTAGSWDNQGQFCAGIPFSLLPDNIATGLQSLSVNNESDISLYPNCTTDKTFVSLILTSPKVVNIAVFDMAGRMEESINSGQLSPGKSLVEIPVSDMPSGMYLVNIQIGKYQVNKKLVVVK